MEEHKKFRRNNEHKISEKTWNEEFEVPNESYSVSDIQKYFELIPEKHERLTNNPPFQIYFNKVQNGITFKIKI